jgi:transcriptional regulator with XRE-family HTH domain
MGDCFVDLSKRIKLCREKSGLSQISIAEKLNITRQAYNHYETGKRTPPVETLLELAEVFAVSLDGLTGRTDIPTSAKAVAFPAAHNELSHEISKLSEESRIKVESYVKFLQSEEKLNT